MPPNCTPEKNTAKVVVKSDQNSNEENLYFNPNAANNNKIKSAKQKDDLKIQRLLKQLPKLDEFFHVHKKIGEGTFSSVYLATLKGDKERTRKFAIKHLVPTCHPNRVRFELECLQKCGGNDNVIDLDLCLRNNDNVVFVMPYQPHLPFIDFVNDMDAKEASDYIKNLLIALCKLHELGIIHRDIKPSNFLYDRINKKYSLVDFGLAQQLTKDASEKNKRRSSESSKKERKTEVNKSTCHCYGKAKICSSCLVRPSVQANRAGTPGFRPPEVLLKYPDQTTAVDVWAVGVILLCILSHSTSFFTSLNDNIALAELLSLFGSEKIHKLSQKLGKYFLCSENFQPVNLKTLCKVLRERDGKKENVDLCNNCSKLNVYCFCTDVQDAIYPDSAYDLLHKLLEVDPNIRITAREALNHDFFK